MLIKVAMPNIIVYYMLLFKMPRKVRLEIEKFQRDFLWEGGKCKKDHLVRWEDACRSKEYGGLGVGHKKEKNSIVLRKWLWRFLLEGGSLLCGNLLFTASIGWSLMDSQHITPSMSFGEMLFALFLCFSPLSVLWLGMESP